MSNREFVRFGKKIVAIGRNFADHAKELGNTVPKTPMFFLKPTSSYVTAPNPIEIPKGATVHHEIELAVVVGKGGRDILPENAMSHVSGYALALDMTARNLQEEARKSGNPWTMAKGFDTFTPIGSFIDAKSISDPHQLQLWLTINDKMAQNGNTSSMIFKIPTLLYHVSSVMTLEEGDVILTGTPAGVGPVKSGDTLKGRLMQGQKILSEIEFSVIHRKGLGVYGPSLKLQK